MKLKLKANKKGWKYEALLSLLMELESDIWLECYRKVKIARDNELDWFKFETERKQHTDHAHTLITSLRNTIIFASVLWNHPEPVVSEVEVKPAIAQLEIN